MTMSDAGLFATIRQMLGRGLTQAEVDAINRALYGDIVTAPRRRLSAIGLKMIEDFEGYSPTTYPDPGPTGKPVTGGWGTTTDEHGQPLPLGVTWPKERWEALLKRDVAHFETAVNTLLGDAPTSQNQFDALVSFAYNVGEDIDNDTIAEGLGDSTLLRKHLAGDYAGAQAEFIRGNRAGGKVLPGLTARRALEAKLYGKA
jgi:GH24 family phage-related lysozyme (muramidase)